MTALTVRETECVYLLAEGLRYAHVADRLGIGHSTVRTHLHSAYQKLGVTTAAQAVLKVIAHKRTATVTSEVAALEREAEHLTGEVRATKLTLRAFDALLAGDRHAALGLRLAADELRVAHNLPRRPQSSPDRALDRILARIQATS